MAIGVRVEVVRGDRESAGVDALVNVANIDDHVETRRSRQREKILALGGINRFTNTWNQDPNGFDAPARQSAAATR